MRESSLDADAVSHETRLDRLPLEAVVRRPCSEGVRKSVDLLALNRTSGLLKRARISQITP
ncbi:MAG: hypothetical protein ACPHRO_11570, partial [Nannocystaceae bacterium]